jgi:nitroreductase
VPNHHVTNPWRFRVLGRLARARLIELAESVQPGSAVKLQRAPTLVAVSAQLGGDPAQDREDLYATALAAYVVLLGAHARGLAGYWRTVPLLDDARGRETLGLAASEEPVGLLYLGTPVQEQRVPERAAPDQFVSYLE